MQPTTATPSAARTRLRAIVGPLLTDEQLDQIAAAVQPAAITTLLRTIHVPAIGTQWVEQGGVYAGIVADENDHSAPNAHQILGPAAPCPMTHAAALEFAKGCRAGGFDDWQLPGRNTGALLYANLRARFKSAWHWLEPQSAHLDDSAWCQLFGYGTQFFLLKSHVFEVALVRRVPIQ